MLRGTKKRGQAPLCEAPFGPFRQRGLTPFFRASHDPRFRGGTSTSHPTKPSLIARAPIFLRARRIVLSAKPPPRPADSRSRASTVCPPNMSCRYSTHSSTRLSASTSSTDNLPSTSSAVQSHSPSQATMATPSAPGCSCSWPARAALAGQDPCPQPAPLGRRRRCRYFRRRGTGPASRRICSDAG
jgi:hypothetical protein